MIGAVTYQDLPPFKREALLTGAAILLDQLSDDLAHLAGGGGVAATNMIRFLPPAFAPRYTARFAEQFLACASAVADELVRPGNRWPACVGEELALHALIDQAEAVLVAAGRILAWTTFGKQRARTSTACCCSRCGSTVSRTPPSQIRWG
jgi:hypothetical protein